MYLVRPDSKDLPFPLGSNRDKKLGSGGAKGPQKVIKSSGGTKKKNSGSDRGGKKADSQSNKPRSGMQVKNGRPVRKEGWAKPKPKKKK